MFEAQAVALSSNMTGESRCTGPRTRIQSCGLLEKWEDRVWTLVG